ncbi:Fic family protein [uncultured Vagococcus sp.]|uniref:Fic family protein n=1 Tax=uncultured Vagococcus sp. TaxID=189676 RepID=UPI00258AAB83|nr:Fic family protein [uncultured Vagococcus sp.]
MSYNEIYKSKYTTIDVKEEYHKRFNSYSSMKTNFIISPMNKRIGFKIKGTEYNLFLNNLPKLTYLVSECHKESTKLSVLLEHLSKKQIDDYLHYLLIEEMQSTNEYEGVKSTRKELGEAIQAIKEHDESHRFYGLSKLYSEIANGESKLIQTPADIRFIYDDLVSPEVDSDNQLDESSLFRNDSVQVGGTSGAVHFGEDPEKIERQLATMINFINMPDEEFPNILKIIISHYMFEYIHPFFDGNGRVGRFILSNYLAKELDIVSSLLMSRAVKTNRLKYEKAFLTISEEDNFGEGTFFVIALLELLLDIQKEIVFELKQNNQLRYQAKVNYQKELSDIPFAFEVFQKYFDHLLYYPGEVLSRRDIIDSIDEDISPYIMRKIEAVLLEKGLIEQIGEKPVTYRAVSSIAGLFN